MNLYGAPALTAERVRELAAGPDRRREPAGIAPWGQYDGSRIVNIGSTAGRSSRSSAFPRLGGPGRSSSRGRDVLHRQRRLLTAATGARRTRSTRCRGTRSTASLGHLDFARRHLFHRRSHDARRRARTTTCSRTGASAGPSLSGGSAATRSSSTPAAACRRGPATTTTGRRRLAIPLGRRDLSETVNLLLTYFIRGGRPTSRKMPTAAR